MTTLANDLSVRDDMNCGAIIGRADLSDDVVIDALKERLASNERSEDAESLIGAAMAGDREAISFMRTIKVPAPNVRLAMPTQPLHREAQRRGFGLSSLRFSWARR
ncbi:hypothetical protein E3C22_13680 [Jiella endophytica]|uniref:Uncharacterized protein n=1 Tax=Jiella endophytica TaxID=2558362 RepID=A0A4Y8RHK4_9HYPH|nr:hypothetical protein [Jiella endophytica]TFF21735.1 hypothetical protein E3C22_13680 [Jiella endophytica]